MRFKRIGCCVLAVILALPLAMPINSYAAARFTDTGGHWAQAFINEAVENNIITGYPDGRFRPDRAVTRAEFASMVNNALGNTGTETLTYTDVSRNQWYYNDVAKALAAAYTAGYDDNTFRPNNPITRQEAAVMISRIVPAYGESGNLRAYSDYKSIADWAYDSMEKANGKGYLGPYDDGRIHPTDRLTRAQTAKIICEILDNEDIITRNTVIDDDGTKLSGKIYTNNVTIDEDLGEDSATIEDCIILGTLNVRGGGTDTITVSNSRVANASIDKDDDPVRILARGETVISKLYASQSSILQTSSLTGGLFGQGFTYIDVGGSAEVVLRGTFPRINVNGTRTEVTLDSGTITTLIVGGRYSDITADSGTTIKTATVNEESYFHGSGTISQMNVNADNVTYEKKPVKWTISSGAETPDRSDDIDEITFRPAYKATDVDLDTRITITFGSRIELYDGDSITGSDIEDFVELRRGSASGARIPYSASVNSAKTVITITPDELLDEDTRYYVIIDEDSIRDDDGNPNDDISIYFTTGDDYERVTTYFSPNNGATAVPVNTTVTISFSEDVVRYGNGASISVNDAYLKECIVFRKDNGSGALVSYSAAISSADKITITPSTNLTLNQKYYLAIVNNKLRAKDDGEAVPGTAVTWTTGYTAPVLNSFSASAGDTSVTAFMTPNVAGKIYAVALQAGASAPTAAQIAAGQNHAGGSALAAAKNENAAAGTSVTLPAMGGLASGKAYDVWAALYSNQSGTYSTPVSRQVTTTLPKIALEDLRIHPIAGGEVQDDEVTFQPGTGEYTVKLNSSVQDVRVRANASSGSSISVRGNSANINGTGEIDAVLAVAANPRLTVTVSGEGKASSTYTVYLSIVNDASLSSLKINGSAQQVGGAAFSYSLSSDTMTTVTLEIKASDKFAIIGDPSGNDIRVEELSGTGFGAGNYRLTLPSGADPAAVSFTVYSGGSNIQYIVTFSRPQPPPVLTTVPGINLISDPGITVD